MMDGEGMVLNRIFDTINHPRRRYLLYRLQDHDSVEIEEAIPQLVAWEQDVSPSQVSELLCDRVRASLYHNHLPKLASFDFIDYDRQHGTIRFCDPPEELRKILDLARQFDEPLQKE